MQATDDPLAGAMGPGVEEAITTSVGRAGLGDAGRGASTSEGISHHLIDMLGLEKGYEMV
jgi:hypothetical protein